MRRPWLRRAPRRIALMISDTDLSTRPLMRPSACTDYRGSAPVPCYGALAPRALRAPRTGSAAPRGRRTVEGKREGERLSRLRPRVGVQAEIYIDILYMLN